jgi:hypothetical protein
MNRVLRNFVEDCGYYPAPSNPEAAERELDFLLEEVISECARIAELKEQGYSLYDPDVSVGHYIRMRFGLE